MPTPHPPSASPFASILLVDDVPANLLALESVLAPLHERLVSVRSAEDALRRILTEDFAVILMDVRMPGMGGFEAVRLIRQRQRAIPIIFVTAFASTTAEMVEGYEAGAVDFVTKPYEPAIIRSKVAMFVELWRARDDLRRTALAVAERDHYLADKQQEALAREQFIGILGHDLRNPLATISLASNVLLDGELTEHQHKLATRIRRSSERMGRMIGDVLDFARGRLGGGIPVKLDEGELRRVLAHTVDELKVAHPTRDLLLVQPEDPLYCRFDPDRIAQAISNLVGNALQHGQDPVRVQVRDAGDSVIIEVTNRGQPIPEKTAARLFEPFAAKKQAGDAGLGLGLYIADQIVRAHRGSLQLRSPAGEELVAFILALPR